VEKSKTLQANVAFSAKVDDQPAAVSFLAI